MFSSVRESQKKQERELHNKRKNWSSAGRLSPYSTATLQGVNDCPIKEKDVLKTFQDSYDRLRGSNSITQTRRKSPQTTMPESSEQKDALESNVSTGNKTGNNSLSYIGMIATAILSSAETKQTLAGIYTYMEGHFFNVLTSRPGWRNTVRHNLSLHDCFIKGEIAAEGKGRFWRIHPDYYEQFRSGKFNKNILKNAPLPFHPVMTANFRFSPRLEMSPFGSTCSGSTNWRPGFYPLVPPSYPYQAMPTFHQHTRVHPFARRTDYHDFQAFPYRHCPVDFCDSCSHARHPPALNFPTYVEVNPTLAGESGTFSQLAEF